MVFEIVFKHYILPYQFLLYVVRSL